MARARWPRSIDEGVVEDLLDMLDQRVIQVRPIESRHDTQLVVDDVPSAGSECSNDVTVEKLGRARQVPMHTCTTMLE